MNLPDFYTDKIIRTALEEDINYIDLATDYLLDDNDQSTASFIAKASGVLCGIDTALRVFKLLDDTIKAEAYIKDGEKVEKGRCNCSNIGQNKNYSKRRKNITEHSSAYVWNSNRNS